MALPTVTEVWPPHAFSKALGGHGAFLGDFFSRFQGFQKDDVEGGDLRNRREGWAFLPLCSFQLPPTAPPKPSGPYVHTQEPKVRFPRTLPLQPLRPGIQTHSCFPEF